MAKLKDKESEARSQGSDLAQLLKGVTSRADSAALDGEEREACYRTLVDETRDGKWNDKLDSVDPHDSRPVIEFAAETGLNELVEAIFETCVRPIRTRATGAR